MATAAAETDAKLVQELQQREESLSSALLEAQASLGNMQRLHQASQNQLFTIQSQTEEQQVSPPCTYSPEPMLLLACVALSMCSASACIALAMCCS